MAIAQHTVAGEGEFFPNDSENNTTDSPFHESIQKCQELVCDQRNLPYQTLRAHQRCLTLSSITARAKRALAAITLTVDARKPESSVFAHRDFLANRAGQSERTWYRAEQDLIDAGLIKIAEQGRKSRGGKFGGAYIYLTEIAIQLLGFLEPVARSRAKSTQVIGSSTSSITQPSATVSDRYTYKVYPDPLSQERQPNQQLPADVEPLLSLGFRKYFLFKLMGIARREHNKKLGDVVTACWEQISQARYPISYVKALLKTNIDFAWLVKQKAEESRKFVERAENENRQSSLRKRIAGKTFAHIDGEREFSVSNDGQILTIFAHASGEQRTVAGNWIESFERTLERDDVVEMNCAQLHMPKKQAVHETSIANKFGKVTEVGTSAISSLRALLKGNKAFACP